MLDHNVVPLFVLQMCVMHYNWVSVSTKKEAQRGTWGRTAEADEAGDAEDQDNDHAYGAKNGNMINI